MSRAAAWANQALDHALYAQSLYVAVVFMKPPVIDPYQASRWLVTPMPSRHDLDQWYQGLVASPERYHYLAAFDKTTPEWDRGSPIAAAVADDAAHVSGVLAPEAYRPAAMHAVARRAAPNDVRTWLYVSLSSGNAITRPLVDYAGAMNALGAYFSSAAAGAMPDVAYWAVLVIGASGPEILHDAALTQSAAVGAVPTVAQLHHLDRIIGQHETFWSAIAQQHPSSQLRAFLRDRWDPFIGWYFGRRSLLDTPEGIQRYKAYIDASFPLDPTGWRPPVPTDLVTTWVKSAALGLSELREDAARSGIPTPDLGTTQHGVLFPDDSSVSGLFPADAGEHQLQEQQSAQWAAWDQQHPGVPPPWQQPNWQLPAWEQQHPWHFHRHRQPWFPPLFP